MATSTCPVARGRLCGTFVRFQKRSVAAEGSLGIDHPVRWVDPRLGLGRASCLRGNSEARCRAGTRWLFERLPSCGDAVERQQAIVATLGARWVNGLSGLRFVECGSVAALLWPPGIARPCSVSSKGSSVGDEWCPVPSLRGEHAGRVVTVATSLWRRLSTSALNISAAKPRWLSCRRSFGAESMVASVSCRRHHHPWSRYRPRFEVVSRQLEGSAAVGSARFGPWRQRRGWSSNRGWRCRAVALGTTVVEAPRR